MKTRQTKLSITIVALALMLTATVLVSVYTPEVSAQTSPTIIVNNGSNFTNKTDVTLTLSATDAVQMHFSTDGSPWSDWEPYATTKNWTLTDTEANKTVSAEFQDSLNQTTSASTWVVVDKTAPYPYPLYDFYSTDYQTLLFDSSMSQDNFGIANVTWNFGDGNTTTTTYAVVLHPYAKPGNYTATLTVTDYTNNSATTAFRVTVPDLSAYTTPTPTPTHTATPTPNPTVNPTATPTVTPNPTSTSTDQTAITWLLIAAVVVVGVVCLGVVLVFRNRWKATPPPPPTVS